MERECVCVYKKYSCKIPRFFICSHSLLGSVLIWLFLRTVSVVSTSLKSWNGFQTTHTTLCRKAFNIKPFQSKFHNSFRLFLIPSSLCQAPFFKKGHWKFKRIKIEVNQQYNWGGKQPCLPKLIIPPARKVSRGVYCNQAQKNFPHPNTGYPGCLC